MKKVILIIVAFIVGAIGGGIVGSYMGIRFSDKFYPDIQMYVHTGEIQTIIRELKYIREERIENAIEELESDLDNGIIALDTNDIYLERTNDAVVKALRNAKEYRSKYPREQYIVPEIGTVIEEKLNNY